jgi:hypothetical protein
MFSGQANYEFSSFFSRDLGKVRVAGSSRPGS